MSFMFGLQFATRNSIFFRFNLLTNWRKCNTLAVTSLDCHQVQINHIINKYRGLGVNQCDKLTSLSENFNFYRTFNTKRTGYHSNIKSKEIWMITQRYTAWNDSFSRQQLIKEIAAVPALSVLHPLNSFSVRDFRSFHTSPRFQASPIPLLLVILKPVQKLLAIIIGR